MKRDFLTGCLAAAVSLLTSHSVLAGDFAGNHRGPQVRAASAYEQVAPGILRWKTSTVTETGTIKLWVYLPASRRPGATIPCVLIASAGTPCFWGNGVGDDNMPEQVPYAQAGYYAISYEVEGECSNEQLRSAQIAAIQQFKAARAGILDEHAAMDFARRLPNIDRKHIYVAGHSSAATLALYTAENDPRVAGCIAYAPVTNIPRWLQDDMIDSYERSVPGFRNFLTSISPITGVKRLKCPLFLFHAEDDSRVPLIDNAQFYLEVKKTNPHVTFVRVANGDHYDSMIQQGIPRGIAWIKQQAGK